MTQKKFYGLGGETYVYVADHPTDSALVLVQKELEVKRYSYDGPETAIELGRILVRRRGELYTAPPKPNFDSDIAALRGTLDGLLKEVQKLRETKNRLLDEGAELIKLRELPENRDLLLELQRAQALLTNQDRTLQQAQDDLNKKLAERAALRVQIEELSKETP